MLKYTFAVYAADAVHIFGNFWDTQYMQYRQKGESPSRQWDRID